MPNDYDLPCDNPTATIALAFDLKVWVTETSKIPTDEDGFNGSGSVYSNKSTNQLFIT